MALFFSLSSWYQQTFLAFALSSALLLFSRQGLWIGDAFVIRRSVGVSSRWQIQQSWSSSFLPIPSLVPLHIHGERVGLEIPILDLSSDDNDMDKTIIVALPSMHLPDERTTLHVYGMELKLPIHQMIVQAAMDRGYDMMGEVEHTFGQVVYKPPSSDSLVGAIGCAAQILIPSLQDPNEESSTVVGESGVAAQRILVRGTYRFVVREVKQSIPFVVAVVDELIDNPPLDASASAAANEKEDDEDDDDTYDDYNSLTPLQLEQRLMMALKEHVDQQLAQTNQGMSPLERSIIEESTGGINVQKEASDEMAAVFEVFQQYIIDACPPPQERYYALAFMAAEMSDLPNSARKKILGMRQGVERLRLVLCEVEEKVRMARARNMAKSITDKEDESQKDLQVGQPELPPWAKSIRRGMRLEYFWNEEHEWCVGTVVEDPVLIVDELIVTVHFEDDDTTHKLPFRPDEKARWRPTRA